MTVPQWSVQMSVGLKPVDDNHQLLFKLLHLIHAEATCPSEGMAALLPALVTLSICHFRCEEEWMAKLSFPGIVDHKQEHDAFVTQVTSFRTAYVKGNVPDKDVLLFIENWIIHHFCCTNKDFRFFLLKNGYVTKLPGRSTMEI